MPKITFSKDGIYHINANIKVKAGDILEVAEHAELSLITESPETIAYINPTDDCPHTNTHRGGAIWEICDDCGKQWADDEGGKPKAEEFVKECENCKYYDLPVNTTICEGCSSKLENWEAKES